MQNMRVQQKLRAFISLTLTSGILNSGSALTNTLPSHWRSS